MSEEDLFARVPFRSRVVSISPDKSWEGKPVIHEDLVGKMVEKARTCPSCGSKHVDSLATYAGFTTFLCLECGISYRPSFVVFFNTVEEERLFYNTHKDFPS